MTRPNSDINIRPVWIDLSRLIWRARHQTPSGIDRAELAYARYFLKSPKREAHFIVRAGLLGARELAPAALGHFLDQLELGWESETPSATLASTAKLLAGSRKAAAQNRAITIIPSHQNWHRPDWLAERGGNHGQNPGRLVLFLHDTIPSDYPEYAREGGARRHEQRLANALTLADGIIVNSEVTRDALARHASSISLPMPTTAVTPIGIEARRQSDAKPSPADPYFLTIGTIEPRKNHMLLLLLWRQMAEAGIPNLPKLIIAGRRGWENEQVLDLIERSRALQDLVVERNDIGDAELSGLLGGARALLMPSFAEGFGMPVAEALAAGTPVIASDLPVYREFAGEIPDYCGPLDGPSWQRAILDYSGQSSPARQAQLERLKGWKAPNWDEHFADVERLLEELE